jgi:hypothetical protein
MSHFRSRRIDGSLGPVGIAVILSCLPPGTAAADPPRLDLSWDACSPLVVDKTAGPGDQSFTLYCSVAGMTQQHRGYQVNLWFAGEMVCHDETTTTPDAWRFDAAGCQFGLATISVSSTSTSCPTLAGTSTAAQAAVGFSYSVPNGITPPGAMRAFAAVAYVNTVQTPDPLKRYQLFSIRFDHTDSVEGPGTPGATCGGFEQPVCFALFPRAGRLTGSCFGYAGYEDSYYLDAAEQPQEFGLGQPYLSFGREPGVWQWCFETTPAEGTTWGGIKNQYR